MNWSVWIRRVHRWVSMAFAAAAVVNIIALGRVKPALWMGVILLLPLALLLLTGLYLFVLPYGVRWLGGRGRGQA